MSKATRTAILFLLGAGAPARADIAFTTYAGYGVGQLQSQGKTLPLSLYPLSIEASYVVDLGVLGFTLGLESAQSRALYTNNNIVYAGVFNTIGGNLGIGLMMDGFQIFVQGEDFLYSSLSVQSNIQANVNGQSFTSAQLVNYSGKGGGMARLSFIRDRKDKQLGRQFRLRFGLSVSATSQSFASATNTITSSDPTVGADSGGAVPGASTLSIVGGQFFFGIIF